MQKITISRINKEKVMTYRRVSLNELADEIRSDRYLLFAKDYRHYYTLLQRESIADRQEKSANYLNRWPCVCFATEESKVNGEVCTIAYNPLLMLTISNIRNDRAITTLKTQATNLPYTRLAFTGLDGKSLIIVCELRSLNKRPVTKDDYNELLQRAFPTLRKIYSDHLHAIIDCAVPATDARCHISFDDMLYLNEQSETFPVDMTSPKASSLMQNVCPEVAVVEDAEDMYQWRRVYLDNLHKVQETTLSAEDSDFESLLLLARYCHETGVPQALAERYAMINSSIADDKQLIRDTFASEYIIDRKTADITKHTSTTALLMRQTHHFLNTYFRFRKNVLNGIVEFRNNDGSDFAYHILTPEMQNTMTIMALESGLNSWDKDLNRYIHSNRIPEYDPINAYLESLPEWDGKDRIADFAHRVPTDSPDWERNMHLWMLSMVAQWMGRDVQHGNAIAPILIGDQATGKSSFCRIILPECLMEYYNDNIHFKDDKSVFLALSSFALVNIDEFDSLSRSQQPLLKYLISKTDVKYRAAYRSHIEQHKRYASFIATTNSRRPLSDPTGSRRFVCVKVTGSIDFSTPVEHDQIYAQLRKEILNGSRYWFTKAEADAITAYNQQFQHDINLDRLILKLFSFSGSEEEFVTMSLDEIIDDLRSEMPSLSLPSDARMCIGRMMKSLGFEQVRAKNCRKYKVIRKRQS